MQKADELKQLLEAGDSERVAAFFRGMPEQERRSYAGQCAAWYQQIRKNSVIQTSSNSWSGNPVGPAAYLAFFCTGTFSELSKAPRWALPHGDEAFEVLSDRRPPWLAEWATHLLDDDRYWQSWRLVRRLVRENLIAKPDHAHYALGIISGINIFDGKRTTVKERLDEDLALLDDEVWRLFEYEGGRENSLANSDRFGGSAWTRALLDYIEAGKLSRERLLACSLEALRRDFNHYRAKWFAAFYDALSPTEDETRASADQFLALLGASAPNIVTWAFQKVQAQADAYAAEALVLGLRPVLEARSKGLAKNALKLLGKLAKSAPEHHALIATIATGALAHPASEVQAAALVLLEQLVASSELPDGLGDYVQLVAPSLRSRLEALVTSQQGSAPFTSTPVPDVSEAPDASMLTQRLRRLFHIDALMRGGVNTLPAASFDGMDLPRLAGREPIVPVIDLDELVDLTARGLEDALGPDDIERALDGVSRLCHQRPDDFARRTAPLLKRAKQLMKRDHTPFSGSGPAADLCGLVRAWLAGEVASIEIVVTQHGNRQVAVTIASELHKQWAGNLDKTLGALSRRVYALSRRVAARAAAPLLGAPTHSGCLVDPLVLIDRVNAWRGSAPDVIEVVLALLRLVPDHRTEALARLTETEAEWQRAIAHALGGDTRPGASVALWAAAARARSPWAVDEVVAEGFPHAGPDVGEPARYDITFAPNQYKHIRPVFPATLAARDADPDCIPLVLHAERGDSMWELGGIGGRTDSSIRWTESAWPIARESFFAAALVEFIGNLDWSEARWYSKTLLEPLLDPATPLRDMGLMLLVTVLAAKEPGEHGLATDAAIAAIEDGRLGSDNFGAMLARLLGTGLVKAARWANTLAQVARASEAHAAVVKLSLEHCLKFINDPPRDYVKLLELLKELCVQLNHGVASEHRVVLAAVKGSSKLAKAAKALLSLPIDADDTRMKTATARLAAMRVSAATRWN